MSENETGKVYYSYRPWCVIGSVFRIVNKRALWMLSGTQKLPTWVEKTATKCNMFPPLYSITQLHSFSGRYKEYFNPHPYGFEQDGVVMLHEFGKRRSWQPDLEMCTCIRRYRLNVGLKSKWRVSFAIKRTLDLKLDEVLFRLKSLSDFEKIWHEDYRSKPKHFFHSYLRKLAADFMRLCCVCLLITCLSSVAKLSVAYYTTFRGIEYRKMW